VKDLVVAEHHADEVQRGDGSTGGSDTNKKASSSTTGLGKSKKTAS